MKKVTLLFILIVFNAPLIFAQPESIDNGSSDFMSSIGQIYVVVAVIISMFIGIVFLMIRLDKKLSKLENQINQIN